MEDLTILVAINAPLRTDSTLVKAWQASKNGSSFGVIQQEKRAAVQVKVCTILALFAMFLFDAVEPQVQAATATNKTAAKDDKGKKSPVNSLKRKASDQAESSSKSKLTKKEETATAAKTKAAAAPAKTTKSEKAKGKKKAVESDEDESMDDEEAALKAEAEQADLAAMMDVDWNGETKPPWPTPSGYC